MPATIFQNSLDSKIPEVIDKGAVGVLPTDTVYGLVCRAADAAAVQRLYALKSREYKPGTVIAADIEQLVDLGVKRRYLKAVEQFWPGAVSVILPVSTGLHYLTQGKPDLAVRVSGDEKFRELLLQTGPLLTTSANLPGQPTAQSIRQARNYFGDTVDFYVDGGDMGNRQPSTVIRVIDDVIEIIRAGAVIIDANGRPQQ